MIYTLGSDSGCELLKSITMWVIPWLTNVLSTPPLRLVAFTWRRLFPPESPGNGLAGLRPGAGAEAGGADVPGGAGEHQGADCVALGWGLGGGGLGRVWGKRGCWGGGRGWGAFGLSCR